MTSPLDKTPNSAPRSVEQFSVAVFGHTVLMASVNRDICETVITDEATGTTTSRITIIQHEVPVVQVPTGKVN